MKQAGRDERLRVLVSGRASGGGVARFAYDTTTVLSEALPREKVEVASHLSLRGGRARRAIGEQFGLAVRAGSFDVLHLCDFRPVLLSPARFVMTVHDLFFVERPDWYPPAVRHYKGLMLRAALRKRPLAIVCVSEYTRARLLELFGGVIEADALVEVIPPTVDPPAASVRGDACQSAAPPYFLTVSTIEPRKNHLTLLEAFRELRRRGVDLRWKVVGAPGYAAGPIAERLIREDGVDYMGLVDDATRDELYRSALFVAVPSLAEGFGYPPLEAMRLGVPVVTSEGSALDETVGSAAVRVNPTEPLAWVDAICAMLEPDFRAQLVEPGLAQVGLFSKASAIARYRKLYERVAEMVRADGISSSGPTVHGPSVEPAVPSWKADL